MKAICRYVLLAFICFSLMGSCSGGEAFCTTQHNNVKMSHTSHRVHVHGVPEHSHLPSAHEPHQVNSSQQCCRTSSKDPTDCTRIFVLLNKTKTFRSPLIVTFSVQIAINCFRFSEENFISEISNTKNSTLASLRTVILLV